MKGNSKKKKKEEQPEAPPHHFNPEPEQDPAEKDNKKRSKRYDASSCKLVFILGR